MTELVKTFATSKHPIYADRVDAWKLEEMLMKGGRRVRDLLYRFEWEKSDDDHYEGRKKTASYLNFSLRMAAKFVGYLQSEAPTPEEGYSFGKLGKVRAEKDLKGDRTQAEQVWYDCDLRGTAFVQFMGQAQQRAMATGHRWILVEMPQTAPTSLADEQRGLRPYLVELSPVAVPNWRYVDGRLVALVTQTAVEALTNDEGEYAESAVTRLTLYIAAGEQAKAFDIAGAETNGAWIVLDEKGEPVSGPDGPLAGSLEATNGEIPVAPLFYARDEEDFSVSATEDVSAISVSYMNISAGGDNDALQASARSLLLFNVTKESFNTAADLKVKGGRMIPFEPVASGTRTADPHVYDSGSGQGSGNLVDTTLARKVQEAAQIAADQMRTAPTSSGEARKVEFVDAKAPTLSTMAFQREQTENAVLRFLCLRWGLEPDASVAWPKRYDVEDTADDWLSIFAAAGQMQADSPTLVTTGLKRILRSKNVNLDEQTWTAIGSEITQAFGARAQAAADLAGSGDDLPDDDETDDDA